MPSVNSVGRDHNGGTFVPGSPEPASEKDLHLAKDEWSKAVKDATNTYDFHATILHLLGIDHEQLTVRHGGIDRRLTDVHGHVASEILA